MEGIRIYNLKIYNLQFEGNSRALENVIEVRVVIIGC